MTDLMKLLPEALPGLSALACLIILGLGLLWGLVSYILTAISLQTLTKRRGLEGDWLSWMPGARYWVLGSLSDNYQREKKNRVCRRRRSLISLMVGAFMAAVLCSIFFHTFLFLVAQRGSGRYVDEASVSVLAVVSGLLALTVLVMALIFTVQKYIALFSVYRSCRPKQAVLFLVLSLLFPWLTAFFLMGCRKKDLGLPGMAPVIPAPIPEIVPETEEESEEAPEEIPAEAPKA